MIVIHLKKKDIVKSKVRGIEMEFDHEKSATILRKMQKRKKKGIKMTLTGKLSLMRQLLRGNLGQEKSFMMLRRKLKALRIRIMRFQAELHQVQLKTEDKEPSRVDPSGPTGREAEFLKFQARV
ncbi:hypothetical protein Dimus_030782 [Dionaea muscipula]